MTNWTERAKREIRRTNGLSTAVTDGSTPTAVTAVTSTSTTAISRVSIGTNVSAASVSFLKLRDKESSGYLRGGSAKDAQMTAMRDVKNEKDSNAASTARVWLIRFPNVQYMEVYFCPAVTHAEALASYPDAVAAEPVRDIQDRITGFGLYAVVDQLIYYIRFVNSKGFARFNSRHGVKLFAFCENLISPLEYVRKLLD